MSQPGDGTEQNDTPDDFWSLGRRIFAMAWPNVLYAFLDQGMGLIDLWLVGTIGADAIAAVGLARRLLIMVAVISMAIAMGATPIVGQAFGADRKARVRQTASQAIRAMFVLGLLLSPLLHVVAGPGLELLKANKQILPLGCEYLQIMALGLLCLFINFTMLGLFRALGQVKTPLALMAGMNVMNVIISYALINGVDGVIAPQGVAGAAWGTIISRGIGAVTGWVIWQWRTAQFGRTPAGILDWPILKEILRIGVPMGAVSLVRMTATAIFFRIFAAIPGPALAATALATQTRMMLIMPALMIRVALQTLVSHCLGQGKFGEAERLTWHMQLWGGLLMGSITIVLMIFARPVMMFLCSFGKTVDQDLLEMGVLMLRISLCGQFFATAAIIFGGALIGGGDTTPTFLFTFIAEWLIMLPTALFFRDVLQLNPAHIWWAMMCSSGAILIMYFIRFRQGKWQRQL